MCAKELSDIFLPKTELDRSTPHGRIISMGTVTESTLLLQRDFTEASGDNNSDSDLMSKDLQTEKLILVVYSIIELVGIIGNLYVIIWSLVGSKKV